MIKADIVQEVANNTGLTKIETEAVFESILSSIMNSLKKGERVDIRGFGNFIVKKKSARTARNPATQEPVMIQEKFVPVFKVSKIMKNEVHKSMLRGF